MIPNSRVTFEKSVEIIYEYDEDKLKKSGFTDEFYVYFFEARTGKWEPVKKVRKDTAKKVVIAETDHFTPFILVAAPVIPNTTTPLPPACIASDFPSGIGGSGGAAFMSVDLHSMYYQDRNYIIDGNDSETVNTFTNLGLRNSLGISTCNGGLGVGSVGGIKCQNADLESAHKFILIFKSLCVFYRFS